MSEEIKEIKETEKVTEQSTESAERFVVFEEALEAILFAAGHPVSYATLARVFDMTPAKLKDKVYEYAIRYNNPKPLERGVMLLTYKDGCQLCTKESYLSEIRDALGIRKSGSLSTAAMETLAVVAYNQPVTRVFVDTIRKVDSSYAMNSLIDRGLIECVGRLDVPGRPMQYGTTSDFLRCFGLNSIEELPTASEDLINMFEKTKEKEDAERAVSEGQLSISDIENEVENVATDTEPTDKTAEEADDSSATEVITEDEPSAEDDIIDID